MNEDYIEYVRKTATSRPKVYDPLYTALGLCTEAGEAGDIVKKVFRRDPPDFTDTDRDALRLELGDTFWYFIRLCDLAGIDPASIIPANIAKLDARRAAGKNSSGG